MKKLCYLSLFILYSVFSFAQQQELPVPKPHQLKWHEAEMGAVFHYDLHVFDGIRQLWQLVPIGQYSVRSG